MIPPIFEKCPFLLGVVGQSAVMDLLPHVKLSLEGEPSYHMGEVNTNPFFRVNDPSPFTSHVTEDNRHTNPFLQYDCPMSTVNVITPNGPSLNPAASQQLPSAPTNAIGSQIYLIPWFSGDGETSVEKFLESVHITRKLSK